MVKGPKNMFKTIFDLRRPSGPNKVPWTVVTQNRDFLVEIFQAGVPMCANTFWWGARPGGVPKGHTSVRKVVRPRSDT